MLDPVIYSRFCIWNTTIGSLPIPARYQLSLSVTFLLMLLSPYFPRKHRHRYFNFVLLQPIMIWVVWGSSQRNVHFCCGRSQYALMSLAFSATVKLPTNTTSLLLCLLIKINPLKKCIKGETLKAKAPIAVGSPLVMFFLDFIYNFSCPIIWLVPYNSFQ